MNSVTFKRWGKPMTKTGVGRVGQFPDLRGACQKRGEGVDTLMRTMN